jgi:hypothetical protein
MSLKEVRQALYDVIKPGKPEWNVYATVPGTPAYPAIVIVPSDDTTWKREAMGRAGCWYMDVHVMVAYTEMQTAQDTLDVEISPDVPDSLHALLLENSDLDGKVMDSTPIGVMFYGRSQTGEAGGSPLLGAQIRVEVREC